MTGKTDDEQATARRLISRSVRDIRQSPKEKIRDSGLWLEKELDKQPLTQADIQLLATLPM